MVPLAFSTCTVVVVPWRVSARFGTSRTFLSSDFKMLTETESPSLKLANDIAGLPGSGEPPGRAPGVPVRLGFGVPLVRLGFGVAVWLAFAAPRWFRLTLTL